MAATAPPIGFLQDRPFYEMVMSYLAATIGLGPVFDPANPLQLSPQSIAGYHGKIKPAIVIDMMQVHQQCTEGHLTPTTAVVALTCMLLNTTYEMCRAQNDHSPQFEFFRHVRNAASHRNTFNFLEHEPSRPAEWAGCAIDHTLKGKANPLFGTQCVGAFLQPADVIALLADIERKLQ
jgi:hypothetical protein